VYTRKGEKMLDPLKKKFDEAGLSVYVHEDFDCTGLPNLEKQIIGAKLGVVIFLADDMKTSPCPFAMRAVIEHRNSSNYVLVHAAELCRFDQVMPDDTFNKVSKLYSKIAISYIEMYGDFDAATVLDDLKRQEKQRALESEDERREASRDDGSNAVGKVLSIGGKMKADGAENACEIGHMSTACKDADSKEAKALADLLDTAPPHLKELGVRFRIFLSHRRATGQGIAGRIFERFSSEYCTFLDSEATFELHNLQMLINKTNVIIFILTEGILDKSLFCLLELLTAIACEKEIVVVKDLTFSLPTEPGEITSQCLSVLHNKMSRIEKCSSEHLKFTDEAQAARVIEDTLLRAKKDTIIYHAEHFASFIDAVRQRLGISDPMALELRKNGKQSVYSDTVPTFNGSRCFCLRNTTSIDFHGLELAESQGVILAQLLPNTVQSIRLDGCGLGVRTAYALADTVARANALEYVNIAKRADGFPLELSDMRRDISKNGVLNYSSRSLFDADVIVLAAALGTMAQKLVTLDLSTNSLSATAAKSLAKQLRSMPKLAAINLAHNYIGDEGLFALLAVAGTAGAKQAPTTMLPKSLKTLNLRDNHIGGKGAEALAKVLQAGALPNASDIDLSHNWLDSLAAKSIAACWAEFPTTLESLKIFRNPVCDDAKVCQLFEPLAKCQVETPSYEHDAMEPPTSLEQLLGPKLIKGLNSDGSPKENIETSTLTNEVVGLYFGAGWCGPCNDFTARSKDTYAKLTKATSPVEIIYISCDRDQPGFEHYYCKHPWLALPFSERDVKARLSSKYGVDSYPTLVFITKSCEVITKDGRSAIRDTDFQRTGDASEIKDDDEVGANISEALRDLNPALLTKNDACGGKGSLHAADVIKDLDCYGIYFSGHWCPHCPPMTAAMKPVYEKAKEKGLKFEIIFLSADRDEESFNDYRIGSMPWLAFEYETEAAMQIGNLIGFQSLPCMALIGKDGTCKSMKGCASVRGDPQCENFPWDPLPVYQLKHALDDWDEKPTLLVLQEEKSAKEQAETMEYLTPLSERFQANVKEGFDKFDILFTVANDDEHKVVKAARKMIGCDLSDTSTRVVLLKLNDRSPHYYAFDGVISTSSLACFLEAYMAGALNKLPLRGAGM